ncbi:uncharacterized protein si:ch211-1a19.3 [Tachysurus vachellii]|uniref:uncharacterized protein si:ch211-1a19.3 n=1 Tax=Tachysurus vachellii TaxID=175792 RepID=UPI00296B551F|nr:uncharacterized protein si:ch211-1a19.3 [Tachysurus vachellii]
MTATKSSHKMRNIVIAILALWSIISLIIIVVWATSPDLKGASECNASLKNLKEKYADEKNTWNNDRHALEELVRQGRTNQSLLLTRIDQLKDQLRLLNQSLDSCLHHSEMLKDNITVLKHEIELHKAIEANLTANITLQEEMIELLQHNLTQNAISLDSCTSMQKAAHNLQTAAEKKTEGCQSSKQFLQKQLEKCKVTTQTSPENDGPPGPKSAVFLVGLLSISILLIP